MPKIRATPVWRSIERKRVGIYCRVSTLHVKQRASLEAQINRYRQIVERNPEWVLVDTYIDQKSGKSITGRQEFQRMIADCCDGKIDMIITKTVGRFGRNTVDTINTLNKLQALGVDVYFEQDNLNSFNGQHSLIISILSGIAQEENENRSFNIRWGIRRSLEKPESKLYNRPCYGYRKDDKGELVILVDEAEHVRLVFRLYLDGYSTIGIIKELEKRGIKSPRGKDKWSKRSIDTMLANEKYMGDVLTIKTYMTDLPNSKRQINRGEQNQYIIENHHMPIITKEQFLKVADERKRRSNIRVTGQGVERKNTHYSMKRQQECDVGTDQESEFHK